MCVCARRCTTDSERARGREQVAAGERTWKIKCSGCPPSSPRAHDAPSHTCKTPEPSYGNHPSVVPLFYSIIPTSHCSTAKVDYSHLLWFTLVFCIRLRQSISHHSLRRYLSSLNKYEIFPGGSHHNASNPTQDCSHTQFKNRSSSDCLCVWWQVLDIIPASDISKFKT